MKVDVSLTIKVVGILIQVSIDSVATELGS